MVALELKEKGNLMELVDPRLGSDFNEEEVIMTINVALQCANVLPAVRPTMSSVVSMLEGRTFIQEIVSDPPKETSHHQHVHATSITDSLVHNMSNDGPWTSSSTSAADLYPINLDSEYWKNRN
ncbi:unnamed protein product [Ilex paraguariensis]|uniref:Uncharacterized protein n=1 Tax=Ilex paraguariensis TaxID=185542 RepID=A0ABC8S3L5_9AQUA